MKKNSVIFLKDWSILIQSLPTEKQLVFWELFMNYNPELICEDISVKPIWNFIQLQLNNMDNKYHETVVERNRINGSKGGRPKTQSNPNNPVGLIVTQKTLNENENEKDNENKKEKKEVCVFNFKNELIALGCDKQHVSDFLANRRLSKAANTKSALNRIKNECERNNYNIKDAIKHCAEKGWKGFEYSWLVKNGLVTAGNGQKSNGYKKIEI